MTTTNTDTKVVVFPSATAERNRDISKLGIDFSPYEDQVRELPMSPREKEILLQSLWRIILTFVELGYGEHPTQNLRDADNLDDEIIRAVDEFYRKAA